MASTTQIDLYPSHAFAPKEKKYFFSEEEIALLKEEPIPHHIALIMDGNRRWARKRVEDPNYTLKGLPILNKKELTQGHESGAENVLDIVEASYEMGIKVVTLYAFSTENWQRSPFEVEALLKIFENYLTVNQQKMIDKGVRFHTIGDLAPFPGSLKKIIKEVKQSTQCGNGIDLVVAFNYGGRDEMCRAFKKMCQDVSKGLLDKEAISPEVMSSYLDTAPWQDPDLLIRTSGEMRLSNFLLWQLAYTEIYVTNVLWPDFTARELYKAIRGYQLRERRIGL